MRINHFYIKFADCHLFTGLGQGVLYFSYPNIKELPYRKWLSNIRYSGEGKGKPIFELEHKWFMYVRLCWITLWWKSENSAVKKILCGKWQDLHKMNCVSFLDGEIHGKRNILSKFSRFCYNVFAHCPSCFLWRLVCVLCVW